MISQAPKTMDGMYWKILWWSYTLHDGWYDSLNEVVVVFEVWWLLGNILGAVGLYKFFKADAKNGDTRQQQIQLYNESLLFFALCGAMQFYNTTVYLFLSYYVDNFSNVANHILSQAIFWGLNGFWALASAIATSFSGQLLLENRLRPLNQQRLQST
jgi:hypothetical protein